MDGARAVQPARVTSIVFPSVAISLFLSDAQHPSQTIVVMLTPYVIAKSRTRNRRILTPTVSLHTILNDTRQYIIDLNQMDSGAA